MNREIGIAIKAFNQMGPGVKSAVASMNKLKDSAKTASAGINGAFKSTLLGAQAFGAKMGQIGNAIRRQWLLIAAAIASVLIVMKQAIAAAGAQEVAERKLEIALAKKGMATQANVKALTSYAEALQKSTGASDDEIVNAQALFATYGMNVEQIKKASAAIVDMSAYLTQAGDASADLNTIAMAVGKAMQGNGAILARYGVVLDEATLKSKDYNRILAALTKQFGGFAEALASSTWQGTVKRTTASFGEMLEALGRFFTESMVLRGAMMTLAQAFDYATGFLNKYKDVMIQVVDNALKAFIDMHEAAAKSVVFLGNAMSIVSKGPMNIGILAAQGKLVGQLNQGVAGVGKSFQAFKTNAQTAANASAVFTATINNMNNAAVAAGPSLDELMKKFPAIAEAGKQFAATVRDGISDTLFAALENRGESFKEKMTAIFEDLRKRVLRIFTDMLADMIMAKIRSGFMEAFAGGAGGGGAGGGGFNLGSIIGSLGNAKASTGGASSGGSTGTSSLLSYFGGPGGSNNLASLSTASKSASIATNQTAQAMTATAQSAKVASAGMSALGTVGIAFAAGLAGTQLAGAITGGRGLAGQKGKFGTLGAIAGGVLGFAVGGPLGAAVGAGLGGFAGGLFHNGGKVRSSMTRADYGLTPRQNDRVIMAQTGEGVITRQGIAALGGDQGLNSLNAGHSPGGGGGDVWNVTIMAVDSKSFSEQLNRNPDAILKIVSRGVKKNAKIRSDIRDYT